MDVLLRIITKLMECPIHRAIIRDDVRIEPRTIYITIEIFHTAHFRQVAYPWEAQWGGGLSRVHKGAGYSGSRTCPASSWYPFARPAPPSSRPAPLDPRFGGVLPVACA
ncbi:hypothetical protein GCM10027580_11730 [Corynebacterium faecale]